MRKIYRNITFWFFIISISIILINLMGYDDKNILLIGLNPILNFIVYKEPFRNIIWSDGPNIYMYISHIFTFIFYGSVINIIVNMINKSVNRIVRYLQNML